VNKQLETFILFFRKADHNPEMKPYLSYLFAWIFIIFSKLINCERVCYGDLGCFTTDFPWSGVPQRQITLTPEAPEKIATKFILYQRGSSNYSLISSEEPGKFNPMIDTKIIIHGFMSDAQHKWVLDIKDSLLRIEDLNVIAIDWSKGNGFPFTQAVSNSIIVGAEIAKFINSMIDKKNASAADFHLIGHSLGAHIAGYAGNRVKGLGRISGLDPAGPFFQGTDPIVHLDTSDALFVDVIHSDAMSETHKLGLGSWQTFGHVDFYPNGATNQPGCLKNYTSILAGLFKLDKVVQVTGITEVKPIICSHCASYDIYLDSIESYKCQYTAYPCESKENFDSGMCLQCSQKGCNRMGYWASPRKELGKLFVNTQSLTKNSYCEQFFKVTMKSSDSFSIRQARGRFTIYFKTSNETSGSKLFGDSEVAFDVGMSKTRMITLDEPIDTKYPIESVFVTYKRVENIFLGLFYTDQWSFEYVEVLNGETQQKIRYCPTTGFIISGQTVEFKKCSN
jgi:pimeloyl-ACP methyl ester carboxylesterase